MKTLAYPEALILRVGKIVHSNALSCALGLAKYGWTMDKISAFGEAIIAAEALTDENANLVEQKEKTGDKNVILDDSFTYSVDLNERVKQCYPASSPIRMAFPAQLIEKARTSEAKMMPLMEILVKFGDDHKLDLAGFGHSDEVQAAGQALLDGLRDKDRLQEEKKESNKSETQNRHVVFDNLVKTVNKINSAGRKAFRNDPAKLVLFQSPWPRSPKAPPVEPPVDPPPAG